LAGYSGRFLAPKNKEAVMSSYSKDIAHQILRLLLRNPKWSLGDIADALGEGMTEDVVATYMGRLVSKGILVRMTATNQEHWLVMDKL
jgi:DNA-binding Lrp family transcriptional regulator